MTVRFRTDSKKIVFRATLIDTPDNAAAPDEAWERARPPYFDLYRDGKFVRSIAGAIQSNRQDVVIYDQPEATTRESDITILLPFYYRNAEIIVNGIGIEKTAKLTATTSGRTAACAIPWRFDHSWTWCVHAARDIRLASLRARGMHSVESGFRRERIRRQRRSAVYREPQVIGTSSSSQSAPTHSAAPIRRSRRRLHSMAIKYDAFLATIREKAPTKPIIAMTPIFHRSDHFGIKNRNGEGPQDYRNAISKVVRSRQAKDKNLFLIDGMTFFRDPLYLLPTDMVHPNNAGEQKMAEGVVAILTHVLSKLPRTLH